jgi:hypothetical protein
MASRTSSSFSTTFVLIHIILHIVYLNVNIARQQSPRAFARDHHQRYEGSLAGSTKSMQANSATKSLHATGHSIANRLFRFLQQNTQSIVTYNPNLYFFASRSISARYCSLLYPGSSHSISLRFCVIVGIQFQGIDTRTFPSGNTCLAIIP